MMTHEEAETFRTAHDAEVRRLHRLSLPTLRTEFRILRNGIQFVLGGPNTRDEFRAWIINHKFPVERLNESIHVMYHNADARNTACEWCYPDGDPTPMMTWCPFCKTQIHGVARDIDSGLRKHMEHCQEGSE